MKIIISAGPTREFIDPVRFVTNSSSGRMGYALAAAAQKRGHQVTLVSGPVALTPPEDTEFVPVVTAAEMAEAVKSRFPGCDAAVMAAAVADYRPVKVFSEKMKKSPGNLTLEFERTEDILGALGAMKSSCQTLVGFAAETEELLANAEGKLKRKNLDWIVANKVSDGFAKPTNACTVLTRDGRRFVFEKQLKEELACGLLDLFGW